MKCINCSNKKLKKIVSIGSQPLSGIFYKKKKHNLKKYPLKLYRCDKCTLVQLKKTAKKKEMFGKTYEYRTSLSNLMISHIKKKIKYLKSNKFLKKKANILDIGSNDGTFLNNIGKSKNLIGIDPSADKFKKFYKKNIFLCKDFFSRKKLNAFIKQKKISINQFDVITSFAMFYDVDNPNSFCKDVELSLTSNGVWMLEFSYLPLMLKNLTYDQICHEHVAYYTLTSFKKIVEKNKMKIIDINFNEINGGSIEILCAKANNKLVSKNKKIQKVLVDEKKIKLSTYKNFNLRINEVKKKNTKLY